MQMKDLFHREDSDPASEITDVRLTLAGWDDEETASVDFGKIGRKMKQMLARWVCLAVGLGLLAGAAGIAFQHFFLMDDIKTLLSISTDGAGVGYDIRKIKSPSVVEAAVIELKLDVRSAEKIRNAISIGGVIPDSAQDQISMYYKIFTQSGANSVSTVESLLNTEYRIERYIVSLDYFAAGMNQEDGLDFMNALLRAYQDYCAKYYNDNEAMGSPLNAVDYQEYDFAEAVNIFSSSIDSITDYISTMEGTGVKAFRSVETGFTFEDLRRTAEALRDIDLDWITSYIVVQSVSTYDAATAISYYEWLIENLLRQRTVERTRLAALKTSIEEYEKNPILIAVQDDNSVVTSAEDLNANYDDMITEKLKSQAVIASYNRSISYYERVIEGFQGAELSSPEDIEIVKAYLADLNRKMNDLTENAAKTVDEFYKKAAFSDRIRVLIPATVKTAPIIPKIALLSSFGTMATVFCAYFTIALVSSMRHEMPKDCTEEVRTDNEQLESETSDS